MLHLIIDSILSGSSATLQDRNRARALWFRPGYTILTALVSLGCMFAAIINDEWDVRIITAIMAVVMGIWAIASLRYQLLRRR